MIASFNDSFAILTAISWLTRSEITEAAVSTTQTEEAEEHPCPEYSLLPPDGKPKDVEEVGEEVEVPKAPSPSGFLIVFQNDEPTAVPVHEFVPFDQKQSWGQYF